MIYLPSLKFFVLLLCLTRIVLCQYADEPPSNLPSCYKNYMVEANNYLNALLFHTMTTTENLLISPLGLSSVLGMIYLAADNKTMKQMDNVLGYDALNIQGKKVHQNNQQLNEGLIRMSRDFVFCNGLFHEAGMQLRPQLRQELKEYYRADIQSANFANQPASTKKLVNDWAYSRTRGKIQEFVSDSLPPETRVLLLNAIYFKGTWKVRFPKDNTKEKPFYVDGKQRDNVFMMSMSNPSFPYMKDEITGYQYLELPYKGEETSMLFVLPPARMDNNNKNIIYPRDLCDILSNLVLTKLRKVEIPRFRLNYGRSLKDTLSQIGLKYMFEPGTSSFFGLKNDLYISDVVQKSVIEVNEEGSEASSVTSVAFIPLSAREVDEFIADRPFEFYIIHKPSNAILFSGQVTEVSDMMQQGDNRRRPPKNERPLVRRSKPLRIHDMWGIFRGIF